MDRKLLQAHLTARHLALKRRWALLLSGAFNPYPPPPAGTTLSPSCEHLADYERAPLSLSWSRAGIPDPAQWQAVARAKLIALIGYEHRQGRPVPIHQTDFALPGGLQRRRFYLRARDNRDLPVDLVWQGPCRSPRPVMLCLHGHNAGAHLSWGEARMPADPLKIANGADYAVQAASRGYVAVCLEQACFGERREQDIEHPSAHPCFDAAHHALLLGRTLLGERVSDVSSVIDWLETGSSGIALDHRRIYAMGNSSGGDTSVYAAAVDPRITGIIAGGCVGFFRTTIGRRAACPDAIIPGILNWLEYDDILALCAPRTVLAVSGRTDHIYPFAQVEAVVNSTSAVYRAVGAEKNLRAVPGPHGHRFYPEVAWPAFEEITQQRPPG